MSNHHVVNTNVSVPDPLLSETVQDRNVIVNTNVSMPNPSMSESVYGRQEWNGTSVFIWGILIVIFILFFISNRDTPVYGAIPAQVPPSPIHGVQTNVAQDKLYIVNPNTGLLSIVDTKTDQIKTMLPFR
ncbi:hypothetical protein COC69_15885 [Bacillus cereus]|uniref:Uncharacterized protein n=1 Tax=Bacillus cereus TaxID=1396 RepID=A0A9X7GVH9_BACCE|nr:hypothetical protein [Bacillus cereus]PGS78290.1 hypothetical protein COC69_15885 [Bacillus cereus]